MGWYWHDGAVWVRIATRWALVAMSLVSRGRIWRINRISVSRLPTFCMDSGAMISKAPVTTMKCTPDGMWHDYFPRLIGSFPLMIEFVFMWAVWFLLARLYIFGVVDTFSMCYMRHLGILCIFSAYPFLVLSSIHSQDRCLFISRCELESRRTCWVLHHCTILAYFF